MNRLFSAISTNVPGPMALYVDDVFQWRSRVQVGAFHTGDFHTGDFQNVASKGASVRSGRV